MVASNPLFPAYQPVDQAGQLLDGKLSRLPLGYQQISGPSNAALTVPNGTRFAIIQVETQAVRWRDDGTNPTATIGMLIAAGGELRYDGTFSAIRFTQVTATAVLNVSYYG